MSFSGSKMMQMSSKRLCQLLLSLLFTLLAVLPPFSFFFLLTHLHSIFLICSSHRRLYIPQQHTASIRSILSSIPFSFVHRPFSLSFSVDRRRSREKKMRFIYSLSSVTATTLLLLTSSSPSSATKVRSLSPFSSLSPF